MKSKSLIKIVLWCVCGGLGLGACEESSSPGAGDAGTDAGPEGDGSAGPLVLVTERETPDSAVQYLHVLEDWPADGELDSGDAVELGSFVLIHVQDGAVFVYQPEDSTMQKYEVSDDLEVSRGEKISFAARGVTGYDADTIWASSTRAFLVDEASGQIILWNPRRMTIEESVDIDDEVLTRADLNVQLQQNGLVADGRAWTSASWRSWETYEFVTGVALAYFDTSKDQPDLRLLHDDEERCAPSGASPFVDEEGNVYVIGDGALGFDVMASPEKTELPQCVMRVLAGETEFDPDFFVDIQEATGSPGFRSIHPMAEGKLLVNTWAPGVEIEDVADTSTSDWYWEYPPYFEYMIVDMESGEASRVKDLPRAAGQFSLTLRVDGINYVQLYDDDGSATLHQVDPDGTVTEVLSPGKGTDVQFLGRL